MHRMIWLLAALTLTVSLSLYAAPPPAEDLAAVLQRQTQELFDAIPPGTKAVWERYLGPQATYTTEDGTVQTREEMLDQLQPMAAGVSGNIKILVFKMTRHNAVAITTYISWHWIFFLNLPIGAVGIVMALRAVRDFKAPPPGRFDFAICAQCGAGVTFPLVDSAELAGFYPSGYGPHTPPDHTIVTLISRAIRAIGEVRGGG